MLVKSDRYFGKSITDAGYPLHSSCDINIEKNTFVRIETSEVCVLPRRCVGMIALRSSKHSSFVCNVGILDSYYCGRIFVSLYSLENTSLRKFEHFAQLVILPLKNLEVRGQLSIPAFGRGYKCLGSTNVE